MCIITGIASGSIGANRFISLSSSDRQVVQTSSAFQSIVGVTDERIYVDGDTVNVSLEETYEVILGGSVSVGDYLTSDSVGRAITASLPGQKYFGKAQFSGTVGELAVVIKAEGVLGNYESNIAVYSSAGTFKEAYETIDDAIADLATDDILRIKAGSYTLEDSCVITKAGVKIFGEAKGMVTITGASGADNCFSIVLPAQSATSEITFTNLVIEHTDDASQVGIQVNNTSNTKKLNVNVNNCEFSTDGGNSIDIDHADTGNAIRLYVDNTLIEGVVNMVTANAGDRMRFNYSTIRGGVVTDAGNYDLEMLFNHCIIKHGGISGGHSNQRCIYLFCSSETDADPNVYAIADADDNVGNATDQIIGS